MAQHLNSARVTTKMSSSLKTRRAKLVSTFSVFVSTFVVLISLNQVGAGAQSASAPTNFSAAPIAVNGPAIPSSGVSLASSSAALTSIQANFPDDQIIQLVSTEFSGRFEGSWWVQAGSQYALSIGVAGATSVDASNLSTILSAAGITPQYEVVLQPVAYSGEQLSNYQNEATSSLESAGVAFAMIAQMPQLDELEISLTSGSNSAAASAALSQLPSNSFTISASDFVANATSRSTYPPYNGGLGVADLSSPFNGSCTSGFTMVYSGAWYGSTAGHCAGDGDTVGIYTTYAAIGEATGNTFDPRDPNGTVDTDFTMYGPTSSHTTDILTGSGGSSSLNVYSYYSTIPSVGTSVCISGVTTQTPSCGVVSSGETNVTLTYKNLWSGLNSQQTVLDEILTTGTIVGGDSGAGVYKSLGSGNIEAAGIASGNVYDEETGLYAFGLFTPISAIDSEDSCRPAYTT